MICAIRCSKALLKCINSYAETHNNLFMDEVLFNTIALQNNLNIIVIEELSNILFRKAWKKKDIKETNLYHPIKDMNKQNEYRN
jgi:hypothetical protein